MTMTISFNETADYSETNISYEDVSTYRSAVAQYPSKSDEIHVFAEKLNIPKQRNQISRPRLNELLAKFSEQIGATLLNGRAGTGKTSLAADFARGYKRVAWYRVEAADTGLKIFSRYFLESLKKAGFKTPAAQEIVSIEQFIAQLEIVFSAPAQSPSKNPVLVVIDDVHHIFDAEWFADFFNALLFLLAPNTHLLLLARSSPAFPLWRLRSKQILGVIDEDLLLFNFEEAKKFFSGRGIPISAALKIYKQSFGRISKLIDLTETAVKTNAFI